MKMETEDGSKDGLLQKLYNMQIPREIYSIYLFFWLFFTSRCPIGTNIYERNWDVLIVLDACRVDALETVADEYDFIQEVGEMTSVGSTSKEWMMNTFTENHLMSIQDTTYISANAFATNVFQDSTNYLKFGFNQNTTIAQTEWLNTFFNRDSVSVADFRLYDPVWEYLPDNNPYDDSKALPGDVTDRAIAAARGDDNDQLIVHYMQPHAPYLNGAIERGEIYEHEAKPFDALRNGVSSDLVWEAYIDNLRFVLDHVQVLLRNIEAETVAITADHGELLGEWGFLYTHPPGVLHPTLRQVPWVETSATDTDTYEPEIEPPKDTNTTVEENLQDLGYL